MTAEQVRNNTAAGQYELDVSGLTAIAAYRREGDVLIFNHTKVPPELEGQGVGSALMAGALEDVRRQGLKCVPVCSFVAAYIKRHPKTQDLLVQ